MLQETCDGTLVQEDPLKEEMAIFPIFLPGKSHGQRTLAGYSHWGHKEPDTTERLHFLSSKMGSLLQSGLLLVLIRLWHPMPHGIENEAQQGLKKDFLTLAMASGLPRWC